MPAAKMVSALQGHRTKKEKQEREEAEKKLLVGTQIKERPITRADKIAHQEFLRVRKLMEAIGKNDDMYTAVINRYCQLHSECVQLEEDIKKYDALFLKLEQSHKEEKIDDDTYYDHFAMFGKMKMKLDSELMQKRKMMFDLEKENLMTVASGIRTVPKTAGTDKEKNPLIEALKDA